MTTAEQQSDSLYQKRIKIQPRRVKGRFQRLRALTIWITLGIYFVMPWVTWGGRQAILFDLPNRRFYVFGITFWPQDFILLSWLLIIAAFALFFITNFAGRVWCGYSCPQTVWTKLYISIERLTEGTRLQRLKLDKAKLSWNKCWRRSSKHILWLLLAIVTAITFVGYFSPIKQLITGFPQFGPWETFWLSFFTLATYINAGWMREQVCVYMCPYARFQSAMFDRDTLVISYDEKRGEPRGSRKRNQNTALGDCIDCEQCVQVCPTGIDIRQGLQMECIGCAACVDVCDSVMAKLNYPKGLVRYSTERQIESNTLKIWRPRLIANAIILLIMMLAFTMVLSMRVPLRLDILRERQHLYRETVNGDIENSYQFKVINMSQQSHSYRFSVSGLDNVKMSGKQLFRIAPDQIITVPINLRVAPEDIKKINTTITITVQAVDDKSLSVSTNTRFIGPSKPL